MNRIQLACYSLTASAFVLAALLLVGVRGSLTQPAMGDQLLSQGSITLMTASAGSGEEALFVLDSINEKLLIYRLDVGKSQLELAGSLNIVQLFSSGDRGGQPSNRSR